MVDNVGVDLVKLLNGNISEVFFFSYTALILFFHVGSLARQTGKLFPL